MSKDRTISLSGLAISVSTAALLSMSNVTDTWADQIACSSGDPCFMMNVRNYWYYTSVYGNYELGEQLGSGWISEYALTPQYGTCGIYYNEYEDIYDCGCFGQTVQLVYWSMYPNIENPWSTWTFVFSHSIIENFYNFANDSGCIVSEP